MTCTGRILAPIVIVLAAAGLLTSPRPLSAGPEVDISAVEDAVICTCGCANMVLSTCLCGHADEMREEIRGLFESGMGEEEVLQALIDRYGERVLATPKQEGFNLTAYTMPFLAILLGGGLVLALINRWKKNVGGGGGERPEEEDLADDDPYRKRLEQELRSHTD
jgi:cytochrome c-type biogenesis protein CcmH